MLDPSDPLPPVQDSGITLSFELLATLPASASSGPPARIQQVAVVPGADGTLAALDTRGVVWLIGEEGGIGETPLLDLRGGPGGFAVSGFETGLRSIAFHPDFTVQGTEGYGKLYVGYSASVESAAAGVRLFGADGRDALFHDVVAELTVADPASPVADAGSLRELFRVEQVFANHNVGQLAFDPGIGAGEAGYGQLFVSFGDGGGGDDPLNAAGDPSLIYGKVLRIDPLADGDAAYTVPPDNPFAATPGALGEVFAYGFRNPQAMSFDDGQLIASDIGQGTIEEVNAVLAGGHYGWDDREGTLRTTDGVISALPDDDAANGYQYPLVQYDHEEIGGNAAVAGGLVYAGTQVVALDGVYLFGDFPSGRVFAADADAFTAALADGIVTPDETQAATEIAFVGPDGAPTTFAEVAGNADGRVDLRFGQTADGEVLVFSKQTGEVFVLTGTVPGEIVRGTDADDTLFGTAGSDLIEGGAGDDLIYGDGGVG